MMVFLNKIIKISTVRTDRIIPFSGLAARFPDESLGSPGPASLTAIT
jgi:hypothetical protein